MKILQYSLFVIGILSLTSCLSSTIFAKDKLETKAIAYQSVRKVKELAPTPNPVIQVSAAISVDGGLFVSVRNLTDSVMLIDQMKSFVILPNGKSFPYYDPTVKTTSTTDLNASTTGVGLNLGAVAGAVGIGGPIGTLMNGVNVSGSGTSGTSNTYTTQTMDLPQISVAPSSYILMSKNPKINGIGRDFLHNISASDFKKEIFTPQTTYCNFGVTITYSLDQGKSWDILDERYYVNSVIVVPVQDSRKSNDALRRIYTEKSDAINEPWWMIFAITNHYGNSMFNNNAYFDCNLISTK